MRVLIGCEKSGVIREAFAKRGWDAWSCDLLPSEIGGNHIQGDVIDLIRKDKAAGVWDLFIAHPECTYLTVAGNKWNKPEYLERFPNRELQRRQAIDFFLTVAEANIPRVAIENPIGIMSTIYRKPDQIIHPWHFGHPVSKATCLWLRKLPKLMHTNIVEPEFDTFPSGNRQSKWHTQTGHIRCKKARSAARSKTFQGIADAMAEQWGAA